MKSKFLRFVIIRINDKIMLDGSFHLLPLGIAACELLEDFIAENKPDAIDDHSQAHGEGKMKRVGEWHYKK